MFWNKLIIGGALDDEPQQRTQQPKYSLVCIAVLYALIVTALFARPLFDSGDLVASLHGKDVGNYFAPIRDFGYSELRQGNLPLWNPYEFSGTPYLGTFQPALLYPINLMYLVLPLPKALNLDMALHVFLLGLFMAAWMLNRGLHAVAAFFCGLMLMLSGPFWLHVAAGHMTMLATLAWTPLIFHAADEVMDRQSTGWTFIGIFAVTMQLLAGLPQSCYATAMVLGVYILVRLGSCGNKRRTIIQLAFFAVAPAFLGAAQLLPGMAVGEESIRAGGLPYAFASDFAFPLWNLVTALAPSVYGDTTFVPYWGQSYLWEASAFVSITGLVLVVLGFADGPSRIRFAYGAIALLLLVLAVGDATPLYRVFFELVPGFDRFRAPTRYLFHATLFLVLLAGLGLDGLLKRQMPPRWPFVVLAVLAAGVFAVAAWLSIIPHGDNAWSRFMLLSYLSESHAWKYTPQFFHRATYQASFSLLIAAGTLLTLALLLAWSRHSRKAVYAVLVLGVIELLAFSTLTRGSFHLDDARRFAVAKMAERMSPEDRLLDFTRNCSSVWERVPAIRGYDPVQLMRYIQFMILTQGGDPNSPFSSPEFDTYHPLWGMLRVRYVLGEHKPAFTAQEVNDALPHFLLLNNVRVYPDKNDLWQALASPDFDPRQTVLLETYPSPTPLPGEVEGKVMMLDQSTDHMTLEVKVSAPAVLLMTDMYAKGWRARSLKPGPQKRYEVLPANFVCRAVPLEAGEHLFRIEYAPLSWRVGMWLSIAATGVYLVLCARFLFRRSLDKPEVEP